MPFKEDFLHFVWQLQYLNTPALFTECGELLTVLFPGNLNTNAGPDFSEAQLKIGDLCWVGSVEIHLCASDWYKHRHQHNPAYENVVLHVVWENDREVFRKDKSTLPTLVLKGKIKKHLQERYQHLQKNKQQIPCATWLPATHRLTRLSMLDTALSDRLRRKAEIILEKLEDFKGDWEKVSYRMLCRNFGFKVNSEIFERLSVNLPLNILKKHGDNLFQLEALLFGTAGFLEDDFTDDYPQKLQSEFRFLKKKYTLEPLKKSGWKFLRMHPPNFPTVRLAQLSAFLMWQGSFFAGILDSKTDFLSIFSAKPGSYWQTHYLPDKKAKGKKIGGMGKKSAENILINTVTPLLMAVGIYKENQSYKNRAIALLENLPPEKNRITRLWEKEGVKLRSAFDTQAALELYQSYCLPKRCLSCKIGAKILGIES